MNVSLQLSSEQAQTRSIIERPAWEVLLMAAMLIAVLSTVSRVETSATASFSLFWPSAGLGFALIARYGLLGLASVALGVALWAALVMGWTLLAVLWAAAASAIGPWITWYRVREHFGRMTFPFSRSGPVLAFMRAQAGAGSVAAAFLGSAGLWFTGHWPDGVSWLSGVLAYWMIETTGALLFAPVAWDVLNPSNNTAARRWSRRFGQLVRMGWHYGLLVLLLTVAVISLLLAGQDIYSRGLLYGLLPLLVVISLRASPTLVHVLILASGALVLLAIAYLERAAAVAGDGTQMLLVALYLLGGTATLQVLVATSAERRRAVEQLERQAFLDAQTRLLNAAGVARVLETWLSPDVGPRSAGRQIALIGLTLSNANQAASLADHDELLALDLHMADQLRDTSLDVQWARVSAGKFQGVWRGDPGELDAVLAQVGALTLPVASERSGNEGLLPPFRPQWSLAAVRRATSASAEVSIPAMLVALAQADARSQQFRRVEVLQVDDNFLSLQLEEAAMVEQVRAAIENRSFLLFAQPIAPNHAGELAQWRSGKNVVSKFEVLVRMSDAKGNVISPAVFMPAAIRAGLMTQVDLAVLEQTFAWLAAHPQALSQISGCAVNLSGPTVGDHRTVEFVRHLFARYGVPQNLIIFEITESLAVADPEVAAQSIKALRSMGSRVAIDDFGTGMATFDYLKRFEVDFIKIDGTFIRALQDGVIDRVIVESMVNVAKCLGVRTVAEFVSTEELYGLVTSLSIDESQGYAFSPPMPLDHWFPELAKAA